MKIITTLDRIPEILNEILMVIKIFLLNSRVRLENFLPLKRILVLWLAKKMEKLDNVMLKVDTLVLDVEILKIIISKKILKIKALPKDDMPESLKAIQLVLDNNVRMIAMLRARREKENTC